MIIHVRSCEFSPFTYTDFSVLACDYDHDSGGFSLQGLLVSDSALELAELPELFSLRRLEGLSPESPLAELRAPTFSSTCSPC